MKPTASASGPSHVDMVLPIISLGQNTGKLDIINGHVFRFSTQLAYKTVDEVCIDTCTVLFSNVKHSGMFHDG